MNGPAGALPTTTGKRGRASLQLTAIVLRRSDFRESSRIVTCLSREHGRLVGLAKGAHRPDSPFLGRLDFLNEVRAVFSADRGGLRLLERVELLRERRELREPRRFVAASHLAQLSDFALPDDRADPAFFDLLQGGLNLLERCPLPTVPQVVLGLELRHLELLGALPDLRRCTACGAALDEVAYRIDDSPGLVCRDHATPPREAVGAEALAALRTLQATPGRQWPELDLPGWRRAAPWPARWLAAAIDLRPRLRPMVFAGPS